MEARQRVLTVGSLFAGIGGFDLGLERAGMRVIWHSEIDPYASAVLRKHWPGVPNHGDIRAIDARRVERPDVLCGGFPCQDISLAGRGAGIDGEQSGLWSEFARLIGELRPRYAVMENVAALLGRGLERVLGDLAALGYDAEWHCIPACAVGAPHIRDRVWIVAYASCDAVWVEQQRRSRGREGSVSLEGEAVARHDGTSGDVADSAWDGQRRSRERAVDGGGVPRGVVDQREIEAQGTDVADADGARLGAVGRRGCDSAGHQGAHADDCGAPMAERRATTECGWWFAEPDVGRVAHGIPSRVDRLRCLGNALVPQVAEIIGRAIVEAQA